uniref:Uncharacterized protein n=1 Tax=Human betaherpesvirus 6 TaxID=10368 RepID=A0A5P9T7X5_9BETA|nr:hypothetical protein [Human betaherpesvirus 6]QFW25555.1 hypothetical protein [Human betaherpesvirus 6]
MGRTGYIVFNISRCQFFWQRVPQCAYDGRIYVAVHNRKSKKKNKYNRLLKKKFVPINPLLFKLTV